MKKRIYKRRPCDKCGKLHLSCHSARGRNHDWICPSCWGAEQTEAALREKAEAACQLDARHLHISDVDKIIGPRGEAAMDSFERDLGMGESPDPDWEGEP